MFPLRTWTRRVLGLLGLTVLACAFVLLWLGNGSPKVGWVRIKLRYPLSWRVREAAAGELADWGEDAEPAISSLAACLGDEEPRVRYRAAHTLGCLGPVARPARSDLEDALQDPEDFVRCEAATAIGRVDAMSTAGVPVLADLLAVGDTLAAEALEELGPRAAGAVPQLVAAVEAGHIGGYAAAALGAIGRSAARAVPALVEALRRQEDGDKVTCLIALGKIGVSTPGAVTVVAQALSEDEDAQFWAAEALGQFGPAAADAIPSLVRAYRDGHPENRWAIAEALGRIDPVTAGGIIPTVADLFHRGRIEEGARVASRIGPACASLVPLLIEALDDPPAFLHAAVALGKIGTPEALQALRRLREGPDELRGALGVFALGYAAPTSPDVAHELVTILDGPSEVDAGYAAFGLGNMGGAASFALPALERAAARGLKQAADAVSKIRGSR